MAEIPDVVALENIEVQWGNDIRDRTVQRYADETERDNLVPLPQSGDLAWIVDINEIQVYDGTGWLTLVDTSGAVFTGPIGVDEIQDALQVLRVAFKSASTTFAGSDGIGRVDLQDDYDNAVDNASQTIRNVLVGQSVPDNAWGKDGDIFIRFT